MALKKIKEIKGYTAEYWKITDVKLDLMTYTLGCELGLYKDKVTREEGKSNQITREIFRWTIPENYEDVSIMTFLEIIAYSYEKIKESKIKQRQVTVDGELQFDNDGKPIMEDYESNWFADSEDVLEQ